MGRGLRPLPSYAHVKPAAAGCGAQRGRKQRCADYGGRTNWLSLIGEHHECLIKPPLSVVAMGTAPIRNFFLGVFWRCHCAQLFKYDAGVYAKRSGAAFLAHAAL